MEQKNRGKTFSVIFRKLKTPIFRSKLFHLIALCTTIRVASSSLDEVDKVVDWVAGLGQEGVRLGFKEVDLLLRHPPRHQTREGSHRPKMLEKYTFQILYSSFICRHVTKL